MASAHQSSETGVWSVEGHSVRVEYWASVLEEIRAAAVSGYCQFPRGGVEIGGILFGRLEPGVTRIVAHRPVACEYKFGPSYQLSEKDEQAFAEALQAPASDALLAGLEPIGWYHSHTRSAVCLTEQDLELHNQHFKKPAQVALVVQPESFGPSRAGFFFREADGSIRAESSYGEFALAPRGRKPKAAAKEEGPAPERPAPRRAEPFPPLASQPAAPPAWAIAPPPEPEPTPRWRWLWIGLALVLVAAIAVATALLSMRQEKSAPSSLALSALDLDGQLQIAWDRGAAAVRQATSGSLEIVDGDKRLVLPFSAAGLRRGSVTYARKSGTVEVRLSVTPRSGGPVEELVRFVGSKPAPDPKPEAVTPPPAEPPPHPAPKAKPERRKEAKRKTRQRAELVEPARPTEPARTLRLGRSMPRPKTRPLGQPPSLNPGAPAALSAASIALPRRDSAPASPPAAPAPSPVAAKPGYRGPASGRLIWTGRLGHGQSVLINGSRASIGDVTGELPGVPVRISAHPADLSEDGLVVYTAVAQSRREPPGPLNGWNLTRYAQDPHRAARVLVTEPPSAHTGWRRLTLRGDEAPVAVVVIDWRLAE